MTLILRDDISSVFLIIQNIMRNTVILLSQKHRVFTRMSSSSSSPQSPHFRGNPLPRSLYPATLAYLPLDFKRMDESPDDRFYAHPRFVQHIDNGAIVALKSYYSTIIHPHHSVIDLCSSWVSHLPDTLKPKSLIGYGMNQAELSANSHLTKFYVRDLNQTPSLQEVRDESIDVVICSVSVDYLTKPVEVLKEVHRVLKKDGTAHMAFSNRCFPTKVVGNWLSMSDEGRRKWVGGYFWACGDWRDIEEVIVKEGKIGGMFSGGEDPMFVVRGTKN